MMLEVELYLWLGEDEAVKESPGGEDGNKDKVSQRGGVRGRGGRWDTEATEGKRAIGESHAL